MEFPFNRRKADDSYRFDYSEIEWIRRMAKSNFRDDHNSYLETPLASVADELPAELAKLLDEPEITLMMRADGVCSETLLRALQEIAAALHINSGRFAVT